MTMRPVLVAALLALASPVGYASSARAEPAPVARSGATTVERELERLATWVAREKGELSAQLIQIEPRRVIAERNPRGGLNPASNAKIATAAASLAKLGAEHRFRSGVYGDVKEGVVARLTLRSDGDPTLSSRDLDQWAKRLVDLGVKQVGEILVDQSAFDGRFVPPAFEQQPSEWAPFRAPVSAVALDRNAFVVRVRPKGAGELADVSVDPAGFVAIESSVRSAQKGKTLVVEMRPHGAGLGLRLSGRVSKPVAFAKRVDDPRLFAGHVLRVRLQKQGIAVTGSVSEGGRAESAPLVERPSEPLRVILRDVGKHSDNFTAEMLLKALGAAASRRPGSSADGAAAVSEWLKSAGASDASTRISNGSGLFDANRLSAASLVGALVSASTDPQTGSAFLEQLAVGGSDGTLKHRFKRLGKRLRGKTGTLARAHSLSGVVLGADGRPRLAFALVVNGIAGKADEQRRRMDRVVERAAAQLR